MPEDYITPRELTPLQVGLAQLNERFSSLDVEVRSIKTNHLPHIQAAIEKLEGVVGEMKDSFLPLVRNLNETVNVLKKTVVEHGESIQGQKFEIWKIGWKLGALFTAIGLIINLYGSKILAAIGSL